MRYCLLLFLIVFKTHAQVYKRICVQYGQSSCVEYMTNGQLQMRDLAPWDFGDGFEHQVPLRTKIESPEEEIKHGYKERIEASFSRYGTGIAYSMGVVAKKFNEYKYQEEEVERNLDVIRGRVGQLEQKDKEISKKYSDSIPALHKQIDEMQAELNQSINLEEQLLDDKAREIQEEINQNPVENQNANRRLNSSIERMEFEAKDKLLSQKRERLLKNPSPRYSLDVIENIYNTSGKLQNESRSAYATKDYESASFGQDLAMGLVDFGLGVTPLVGDGIALYEAFFGENPITNNKLSKSERVISATTGIIGLVSLGTLGAVTRGVTKGAKFFNYSDNVSAIFKRAGKLFENASKVGLKTKEEAKQLVDLQHRVLGSRLAEEGTELISSKLIKYGPLREGPLSKIPTGSGSVADTFRSSSYFEHVIEEPLTVYRVYGGQARDIGPYWSRLKPTGPGQATLDAALLPEFGNTAQRIAQITIPRGTKIYEGVASSQTIRSAGSNIKIGELLGNGSQIYIDEIINKETWKFITEGF